jgi:hypothetical protein
LISHPFVQANGPRLHCACGWRAVAPDLRGYNLSDKPEGVEAYRAKHLVADIGARSRRRAAACWSSGARRRNGGNPRMVSEGFSRRRFGSDVSFDRAAYLEAWSRPGALAGGLDYYRASPLYPPAPEDPGPMRLQLDPKDFVVRVPTLVL